MTAAAKVKGVFHGQRSGPKGDTTVYLMPRDIDAWEAAWAAHLGQQHTPTGYTVPESKPGTNEPGDPIRKALHSEAVAFIRDYTGTFGFILDLRARPAWGTKWYRLSDKQVDAVLRCKAREVPKAAPVERPITAEPMTDGMYRIVEARGGYGAGSIFKVQIAVHGSGHLYAKVLVVDGPGQGHFEFAQGAIRLLTVADRMSGDEAAEFGRLYGICIVCGATLTDEASIERGIGPICAGKV